MSSDLGNQPTHPPPATRTTNPGWRDPRLWVGVVVVAVSVVAGSRLLASADDTVEVWAVQDDVAAGDVLVADDLTARRVRFADGADLERYLPVEESLPDDARLLRGVGAGELVPRAALGSEEESGTVEVPVEVEPARVPPSVAAGSVVDVYVGEGGSGQDGGGGDGGPALEAVSVVEAPAVEESFGTTGTRLLVLAVPEAEAGPFVERLGGLADPVVRVVKRS